MGKQNPFVKALVDRGIPYVTACDIYLENLKPIIAQETKKAEVRGTEKILNKLRKTYTLIPPPANKAMELTGEAKQYNKFVKDLHKFIDLNAPILQAQSKLEDKE